jgi:DNA-binding CsgD family transcriptional regulator
MARPALSQACFAGLATARSVEQLRFRLMDAASELFEVPRWGIYLQSDGRVYQDVVGVSESFVDRYNALGRDVDPVLAYVAAHHAPAHEALVVPGKWEDSELYLRCCGEADNAHIMTGPIVLGGQLVGTIQLARRSGMMGFTTEDLLTLGAIGCHFSVALAGLVGSETDRLALLTEREWEVVTWVGRGMTNRQIGRELWITENSVKQALKRIFRKLGVRSRVELVRLVDGRSGRIAPAILE